MQSTPTECTACGREISGWESKSQVKCHQSKQGTKAGLQLYSIEVATNADTLLVIIGKDSACHRVFFDANYGRTTNKKRLQNSRISIFDLNISELPLNKEDTGNTLETRGLTYSYTFLTNPKNAHRECKGTKLI